MTDLLFSCEPRATVQYLYAAGELVSFETLALEPLSNVDWADPGMGERLLPCHWDRDTDQACRRPALRCAIVDWIESQAGPMSRQEVLDLFCGCGTLTQECAARGVPRYCGVDINPVLVRAGRKNAPNGAVFHCDDVVDFVASSDLGRFSVILLLYECLNALGKITATALLHQLERRCAPGTWIFGDTRANAQCPGLHYEAISDCPYLVETTSDLVIREYGHTRDLRFFGNRYISVHRRPLRIAAVHSMLELYSLQELKSMVTAAGLQLIATKRLLQGYATDVPESSSNIFFVTRTRGPLG